jgi:hypothetical protein
MAFSNVLSNSFMSLSLSLSRRCLRRSSASLVFFAYRLYWLSSAVADSFVRRAASPRLNIR